MSSISNPLDGQVKLEGDKLALSCRYDPKTSTIMQTIPGSRWDYATRQWSIPLDSYLQVQAAFPTFAYDANISPTFNAAHTPKSTLAQNE